MCFGVTFADYDDAETDNCAVHKWDKLRLNISEERQICSLLYLFSIME